ncbi:MAG: hypothetical protein WBA25_00430 [Jannaschia sp.]
MIRSLPRLLAAALAATLPLTAPATAQTIFVAPQATALPSGPLVGQRADVARELPRYGYGDVDVRRLSSGQVAQIAHLIYSGRSEGDIRGQIGSTLRRGLLQRGVDRVIR